MTRCQLCLQEHATSVDRWACDAIHGVRRSYPDEVRRPLCVCELCGVAEPLDELLEHFFWHHRREQTHTGRLVRYVQDLPDVSTYPRDDA